MPESRSLKEAIRMIRGAFSTGRQRSKALKKAKTSEEKIKVLRTKFKP